MRALVAAILALGCPMAAAAQSRAAAPAPLPVLPPIGLPLAPIGLPLAPIGLPPASTTTPDAQGSAPPHARGPRGDRGHDRRAPSGIVYVVPAYDWLLPAYAEPAYESVGLAADSAAPAPPLNASGRLRLEIEAAAPVQVLVDGYYAGTLAELNDELELEPGPHRLEFRAAGHETAAVDILVATGRSIRYRASLTPIAQPSASEAPAPRSTIYFIPGCYLGNVHPSEVSLPSGCDLAQLVIRKP